MSQEKALDLQEDFINQYNKIHDKWAPAEANYKEADSFFKNYQNNMAQIADLLDGLQTYNKDEGEKLFTTLNESKVQAKKDEDFVKNAEEFIQKNTEELAKKIKHLDALKAKMKEVLNNLSAKKLGNLKVNEEPALKNLFQTLYEIYYKAKKEEFDWAKFKANAIVKDKCDDFAVRLCTFDFGTLDNERLDVLNEIKKNPVIEKIAKENKNGENLLDILDYLEYVPEAAKAQSAITQLEADIKKIKSDKPVREVRSVALRDKAETITKDLKFLEENDKKYAKFITDFSEHLKQYEKVATAYNSHRATLYENVVGKYNEVQAVPVTVYK